VDLAPVKALARPVALAALKADKTLADLAVVRKPRISVVGILSAEFTRILEMAETRL
jgi:predicted RNA-binding protein with PUA-like domain